MSSDADWQELHFTARKDQVEALEDWLFAHGALSVTLEDEADQPLLESRDLARHPCGMR